MPRIALGSWENKDQKSLDKVIKSALENGYKHIDTAQIYFTEELIGSSLKVNKIKREDLWITTKIWPFNYSLHAYNSIEKSLERLGVDYVDTILLHAPISDKLNLIAYKEAMRARENGLVRDIGVSNFTSKQIDYIFKHTGEYPKYNQVIASVIQRLEDMENYSSKHGITLMGYSSIRPYYNSNKHYPNSELTMEQKNRRNC